MPELPEVETTKRGIERQVLGKIIRGIVIRETRLRWPVPDSLPTQLEGQYFQTINRRGKYLLFSTQKGTVILHLGMSGNLRILRAGEDPGKHDHVDIIFEDRSCLRFHDPRRFGCLLWVQGNPYQHALLASLGPEPLSSEFSGNYLYEKARGRKSAIKTFIMDSRIVVGVGNIYANEALFMAGINPRRRVGRISKTRMKNLRRAIHNVLQEAIKQGGTTLRDFVNEAGNPGYFQQTLRVYGRVGRPCTRCSAPIRCSRVGQRSSFYCLNCQR